MTASIPVIAIPYLMIWARRSDGASPPISIVPPGAVKSHPIALTKAGRKKKRDVKILRKNIF
jgi:hypothetical protein